MMNKILQSLVFLALAMTAGGVRAQSVCARVTLEIPQEATLELQGFEPRMRIMNGFPGPLTDVHVTLHFSDGAGNPVSAVTIGESNSAAAFFYSANLAVGGTTAVPHPDSVAKGGALALAWTVIPATTAAKEADGAAGTVYQISAELSYTLDDVPYTLQTDPKNITVKPGPLFQLDYFVQNNVSGDDPFTPFPAIEPSVPFPLGLRLRNVGRGAAQRITIVPSGPNIVRNDNGALIRMSIDSLKVNDLPTQSALGADVRNLQPGAAAMLRWGMTSSVSGQFVSFQAQVSHSDALGGALTSRVSDIKSYLLEGEVLADGGNADGVVDFLAWNTADTLSVFESRPLNPANASDTATTLVLPENINMNAVPTGGIVSLASSHTVTGNTFAYASGEVSQDYGGNRKISRVVRVWNGTVLPPQNAWISKHYDPPVAGAVPTTHYVVHVFDRLTGVPTGTNGGSVSWRIETTSIPAANHAPVFKPLRDVVVSSGSPVAFVVEATDVDAGDTLSLSLFPLPYGSTTTIENGTLQNVRKLHFSWTPGLGGIAQGGDTTLKFYASDGKASTLASMVVTVADGSPIEAWKKHWWGANDTVNSANDADPDGDGLANLYEYALGLDPTKSSTDQRPVLSRELDTSTGKYHLALTVFHRTHDSDPSLTVDMLASADPAFPSDNRTEISADPLENQSGVPFGFVAKRFLDPVALDTGNAQRFVRLRVVQTP